MDSSGYRKMAVQIQVEGEKWEENIDRTDDLVRNTVLKSDDIRKKILEAGYSGLGRSHFPQSCKTDGTPKVRPPNT
jgi:electron transport complex protein RnfC